MSKRPNIVFIFADQHRHDALGCAGNEIIQTPNLDRLATSGVRFANTWCQSPICQPSRAALITGRYPHELGVMRNFGPDMDSSWPTFMKQLQNAGYNTANIGKTHYYAEGLSEPDGKKDMREHAARVAEFGFDHVVEEFDRYVHAMDGVDTPYTGYLKSEGVYETYRDQIKSIWRLTDQHWNGVTSPLTKEQDLTSFLTREAQSWLARQTEADPFFLQLSYVQPHVPLMGDPEWADYYKEAIIPRGPTSTNDHAAPVWQDYLSWCGHHANAHLLSDDYVLTGARQYYAMISLIDESIGQLLEQLKSQSMLEDTWIIYSSDHGEMLGDHGLMAKFNFYKSSVQVPLIIRPAGGCEQSTSESLAAVVDIGPTLLDVAGAQPLDKIRGRSLLPVITEQKDVHETLFSEIQKQSREEKAPTFRAVRNSRYRLTVETNTNTPCELFDLHEDPYELNNRASDPEFKALRSELIDLLSAEVTTA
ncbi:MAG: sulfatase-like hydrolase/transferase [Pseudomonadales bacterium]|nr:sulfatase-like hydrolase/transferase [Pseudomonadales bacterium]